MMFVDDARRLGAEVEEAWRRTGDAPEAFAEIASTVLECHALQDRFNQGEFSSWLGRATELPAQLDPDSVVGSPSVTLWRNGKFVVDIDFWSEPEVALHDRGFSGAFGNLIGETIHCIYGLAGRDHPEPGIMLTSLDLETVEQLREGMVRTIYDGRRFVHRLWHISRPTVSICVRTIATPPSVAQYVYYPPGFGIERRQPHTIDDLSQKQMAFMHFLAATTNHQLEWYVDQVIDRSQDLKSTLNLILGLFDSAPADVEHLALINRLLDRLHSRYAAWVEAFGAALVHRVQEKQVLWSAMHDVDHRLLAVLLQTYVERSAIDDAIRRFRDVDQPDIWIADRLAEMIEQGGLRLSTQGFQYTVLRNLILGRSETETIAVAMSRSDLPTSASQVRELCVALRQVDILQPLIAAA